MLEQYPTGAHLAACVLAAAHERGDIEDRVVADLGVGGGVLTIASLLAWGRARRRAWTSTPARSSCAATTATRSTLLSSPTLRLARIPRIS